MKKNKEKIYSIRVSGYNDPYFPNVNSYNIPRYAKKSLTSINKQDGVSTKYTKKGIVHTGTEKNLRRLLKDSYVYPDLPRQLKNKTVKLERLK